MKKKSNQNISLLFSNFSKKISRIIGSPFSFLIALFFILIWIILGPVFQFSNGWQLIINTFTTIITFLIVFLIQHTQNRDTEIINLKIDELIKSHKGAKNSIIDLNKLSDEQLSKLEESYKKICDKKTGE